MPRTSPEAGVNSPRDEKTSSCYRFAEVEIDPAAFVVRIDGRPRDCSRKAFELLLFLCRHPGRVLPRDEIMDALWPGGQLISDEALTQIVFRTRAVLGQHGALLRTIRGVGLKLDSEVTEIRVAARTQPMDSPVDAPSPREPEPPAGPEAPAGAAADRHGPAVTDRPTQGATAASHRWLRMAGLVMLLLAGWMATIWMRGPDASAEPMLDDGYGLRVADLRAARADTAGLLREALANEAGGERERAARLLTTLHATDLGTPVPAIYLAIWNKGDGDLASAREWARQAHARVGEPADLYYSLWLAFVDAELAGDPQAVIDAAGALLDVRPKAWRMRHARGHLMEYLGMRSAALLEIQQIEVPELGHRKRDMVIADRASMGDVAGAQAILDGLDAAQDPVMHAFLSGRLAWTRGEWDLARDSFRQAAGAAFDMARLDLQTRALSYAGAIEVMRGRDDTALADFEAARQALAGRNAIADCDLSLLIAQMHALAGRAALARSELDRALSASPDESGRTVAVAARFAAWRLFPDRPPTRPADLDELPAALWDAFEARQRGDQGMAGQALARAQALGAGSSRFADEARWLEWQLGLPVAPASIIDPPHPPLSRVILRREIRRGLAAAGIDAGVERP